MKRNWWYLVCYAVIKRFDYVIDEIHTLRLIAVWYICLNIILVVVVVVEEEEEEEEEEDEECLPVRDVQISFPMWRIQSWCQSKIQKQFRGLM